MGNHCSPRVKWSKRYLSISHNQLWTHARESQLGAIVDSAQEVHQKRQGGLGRKNLEMKSKMPRGDGWSHKQ